MSHYEDLSLPPIGGPTRVKLPDGRFATISVTIDGESRPRQFFEAAATAPEPPKPVIAHTMQPAIPRPHFLPATFPQVTGNLPAVPDSSVFDDSIIGSKFTIFMLLYGDYPEMHRQALDSLLATLPAGRAEVRLGSNELCDTTRQYIDQLLATGKVACHYAHRTNIKKYPLMREMFHDALRPITTNYVIWFDDDTMCDRAADWLKLLAELIVKEHPNGARLFGPRYIWTLNPSQVAWVKQAATSWYKGRPFQDQSGMEVPNGNKIHFATGSFWALATHVIREQDIPDKRLGHNGGDWLCGIQVQQGGWKLCSFSNNKTTVRWSSCQRRGLSERPLDP